MLNLTDAFAMLGISLVLCSGLFALLAVWPKADAHAKWVKLLTALGFVLLWIPVGEARIPAVAYARGITADLSITLIAFAVWHICQRALGWSPVPRQEQMSVMAAVAAAALFLYPLALGLGDWDAYRPGWGSWGMLLALLALCSVCWFNGLRALPALVALALLAWSLDLMESGNLWDYLLDPWLSVFALWFVFIKFVRLALGRFR